MKARASKIKVLIVDDEPLARRGIAIRLRNELDIIVQGECESGGEAVKFIRHSKPDLVFLDVQMPGMNGIDVLRSLNGDEVPCAIFVTAYDEYAIDAFELHALDYVLKPIEDDRFTATLNHARQSIALRQQQIFYSRLDKLLQSHSQRDGTGHLTRFSFIQAEEVDWIEAVGDYAGLHVGKRIYLLRETLQTLEVLLNQNEFLRIHRSAIVRIDRVARIETLPNRDCALTLQDGSLLRVSRTYSKALRDLILS